MTGKYGFGELFCLWRSTVGSGNRKVMWQSTKGCGCRKFIWWSTNATCGCQVPYGDSLALISTRSGTKLVRDSFAHFLTRLEKTSPSVQCVAKCRRSQMSPRETCQPHIAVCWQVIEKILENKRILRQTLWIYIL